MTILEALASGTPVVATAVGGIPEQIRSLRREAAEEWALYGADEATGVLVGPHDAPALAGATVAVLADPAVREMLGRNARRDAERRFDVERQADAYLGWYHELRRSRSPRPHEVGARTEVGA
jgi:glycosyltransferase involved in cell wall biosynthesis